VQLDSSSGVFEEQSYMYGVENQFYNVFVANNVFIIDYSRYHSVKMVKITDILEKFAACSLRIKVMEKQH
jgi:hypothetical protein